jgi:hypothetical protein
MPRLLIVTGLVLVAAAVSLHAEPISSATVRLRADLTGPQSATQVLTHWCADLGLASPAVIKAMQVPSAKREPSAETRALLAAKPGEPIRYRRVQLMCGSQILSEADNWYLPDKLSPQMNRSLDTSDIPFGTVVRPLAFHRKTLAVVPQNDTHFILQVRALLVSGAGTPFSLVVENYSRELADAKHGPAAQ